MKIKKITAENTRMALQKVKKVMGEDAVILHIEGKTDPTTRKEFVEVTAAQDDELRNERSYWSSERWISDRPHARRSTRELNFSFEETEPGFTYSRKHMIRKDPQLLSHSSGNIPYFSELQEVKEQLNSLSLLFQGNGYPELSPPFLENYVQLLHAGVDRQLALQIVQEVENGISEQKKKQSRTYIRQKIIQELERFFHQFEFAEGEKEESPVNILVGPTGVGKTTCIAKLSALDKIYHQKKVGLISIDTYRIGAIEQLRTYARITRIPLLVVYKPDEIPTALQQFTDCDVIYVDTPGKSQKNRNGIEEMAPYFHACEKAEIHLVLSLTSKEEDMKETVERFSIFPVQKLLFTKLDETNSIGSIVGVVKKAKKPISYIATGQNVPDEIMKPDKESMAKLLMGETI